MNIIKKYVIISPSGVPAPVAGPRNIKIITSKLLF